MIFLESCSITISSLLNIQESNSKRFNIKNFKKKKFEDLIEIVKN